MDPNAPNPADVPAPDNGAADSLAPRVWYQEAFEFAPDGQMVTDGLGLIREANHTAAALLRCSKEFLAGKPLGLFVAAGYRPRFYECLSRLYRGVASESFETRLARAGEEPREVVVSAHVLEGGPGTDPRGTRVFRWLVRDVTARKRAEAARTELLQRLVTVQEEERRRVARELHDSVGQLLTALRLAVRAARDSAPLPPPTTERMADIERVTDELGRAVHDLAVRLRPTALDDLGLHLALAQHLADWSARTGVEVDYQPAGIEAVRLPADVETAVYRVVQEALTNVARHARARRVSVTVGRHDDHATAAVEDDGVGFDPDAAPKAGRLGLIGMRERVTLAGGALDVESSPGGGTTVIARFPLRGGGGDR